MRGEISIVVAGAPARTASVFDVVAEVLTRTGAGERLKAVVAEVAEAAGVGKSELYAAALARRSQPPADPPPARDPAPALPPLP